MKHIQLYPTLIWFWNSGEPNRKPAPASQPPSPTASQPPASQSDSKVTNTKSQVAARSTGIPEEQEQESGTGVEGELKAESKICGDSISDRRENKVN